VFDGKVASVRSRNFSFRFIARHRGHTSWLLFLPPFSDAKQR